MKIKFLSLEWFLDKLNLEKKKRPEEELTKDVGEVKLYVAIKLVNSSLSVVLTDGSILSKPNATENDYNDCLAATTVEEIKKIISDTKHVSNPKVEREPEEIVTEKDVKTISNGFDALKGLKDFNIDGNVVYWGEIKRSLPQQLIVALCKLVDNEGHPLEQVDLDIHEGYLSLKKFWLKCCLNPNAQSAEDLYTFLANHKFKIDRHGNFYAYRRVRTKADNTNKALAEFVSNTYTKVKAVWKKNPKNFRIVTIPDSGEYLMKDSKFNVTDTEYVCLGDLYFLYHELPTLTNSSYTSAHTGLEDYRIGEVISMPRDQGDDNNNVSCSTGFHAASKKYDYSGFGDTPILMIINPMDVLSVPKGEVGKLRTCRWFFACVLDEKEKFILDEEGFDVTDLGDLFEEKIQQTLSKDIKQGFAEEVKRHKFYVPTINETDIKIIVKNLEDMQKEIKSRIKKL